MSKITIDYKNPKQKPMFEFISTLEREEVIAFKESSRDKNNPNKFNSSYARKWIWEHYKDSDAIQWENAPKGNGKKGGKSGFDILDEIINSKEKSD